MILSVLCISVMDAVAKDLVQRYPVMPLLAVRAAMVVTALFLFGLYRNGWRSFHTRKPAVHLLRMVTAIMAPAFNFLALRDLPLTDATVIFFGAVFFITGLSWPVLGEKVGLHRSLAVIVGFLGVVIVIQPSFDSIRSGAIFALLAAFSYAMFILLSRKMSTTESTFQLVFSGNLGILLGSCFFVPTQWVPLEPADFSWIALMAVAGLGSHILLVKAFSMADVGTLAPFEYTGAIWAVIFGFFIFGEIPTFAVLAGGIVVILSGYYVIRRERLEQSPAALKQPAE